jgi:putative membrane protein
VTLAHGVHGGSILGWLLPAAVLLPVAAYGNAVRLRRAGGRRWPRCRAASFLAGLVTVAVAVSPPLQAAGHGDLTAHMVQHLLLGMFAPLALVLAAPVTLLLGALPVPARRRAAGVLRSRPMHLLGHPAAAALLDVGGLHLLYLTPLYALARDVPLVHHLVTGHVLLTGCLYAWSIAGPDPAPHRPGTGVRVAVLVVAGAAHGHLAKLLHGGAAGLPPGVGAPAAEVEAAAQLMYYGGSLAELALALALFRALSGPLSGGRRRRPVRPACGASAGPRRRPSCAPTTSARTPSSVPVPPPARATSRPWHRPGQPPHSPAGR